MGNDLRVVVIVSPDPSDIFFANQLMKELNVVGVIVERMLGDPDTSSIFIKVAKLIHTPRLLIDKTLNRLKLEYRRRFAPFEQQENAVDFGEEGRRLFPHDNVIIKYTTGVKDINAPVNVRWVDELKPDILAVCGASILKKKILSIPSKGVLNLHGGLSQYYRGLFTTDWAVYNEEPECIGATVHFVSPGIDDGDIVYQGRPEITKGDNPHTLYEKVVRLGVKMMTQAIIDIDNGTIVRTSLPNKGTLYLGKSYTPEIQARTWKKLKRGVIEEYLQHKKERDSRILDTIVNEYGH